MPVCRSARLTHRRPSGAADAAARFRSTCPRRYGAERAVDRCPVCGGGEFYMRKDFDPKVGLAVVIVGATISGIFYWFGRDLIAYSILAAAALIDLVVYGRLKDITVCYRCHSEFRGAYPTHRPRFRSPHRGRARAGIRTEDRTAVAMLQSTIGDRQSIRRCTTDRRSSIALTISEERHLHHASLLRPCSGRRESRCSRRPATGS